MSDYTTTTTCWYNWSATRHLDTTLAACDHLQCKRLSCDMTWDAVQSNNLVINGHAYRQQRTLCKMFQQVLL